MLQKVSGFHSHFPWIPRANTCNVNLVDIFFLSRISQQTNTASCFRFRNCQRTPLNGSGFRNFVYY